LEKDRRQFLAGAAALASGLGVARAAPITELRIGYQKTAVLLLGKAQKLLETRFAPQGVPVKWVEFAFGPPLLEAVNAGAVDYGYTGDAPPIFAQAAHAKINYAAVIPARGYGQAIVVPADLPRTRHRSDPRFGALEEQILSRLLGSGA
jgi:ABC-type nitrate/sulfonate/bicarbonate transport system substrate-binding protein